jgi:hypothetical protein
MDEIVLGIVNVDTDLLDRPLLRLNRADNTVADNANDLLYT